MIFAALSEAADKGELLIAQGGLCRWHRRRDGIVVIREVLVLPERRGEGIGRVLVDTVRHRNPGSTLLAKCPVPYPSNRFWSALGFTLVATKNDINEWRLECA